MAPWLKTLVGLVLGFIVGAPVSGFVMGAFAYSRVRQTEVELRRDNELAPVIVAARDLQPLHPIALDDIAERKVPKRVVTSSIVAPDKAKYVVAARLAVPVRAGDMIQWAYLALPGGELARFDQDIFQGCLDAMATGPAALKPESTSAEIRARLAAEAP